MLQLARSRNTKTQESDLLGIVFGKTKFNLVLPGKACTYMTKVRQSTAPRQQVFRASRSMEIRCLILTFRITPQNFTASFMLSVAPLGGGYLVVLTFRNRFALAEPFDGRVNR